MSKCRLACGETIKAVAVKGRFCGTVLAAHEAAREAVHERTLFDGHPAVLYSAGLWVLTILTLGIAGLVLWMRSLAIRFELTTQRVRIERGVFSKTKDSVELFRIDHFDIQMPLVMRMVGHCILRLRSSDPSHPSTLLYGIPHLENLADTLHERTRRRVTTFVDT